MDTVVVTGVRPWDGRYGLDLATLTTREWGMIKRFAGYMPLTIIDGVRGGDPELITAFAVIALHRAGRVEAQMAAEVFERLTDAEFGAISYEPGPDEEADASPPPPSSSGSSTISGGGSPTSSERSEIRPSRSGTPSSDTSASALETSVS